MDAHWSHPANVLSLRSWSGTWFLSSTHPRILLQERLQGQAKARTAMGRVVLHSRSHAHRLYDR